MNCWLGSLWRCILNRNNYIDVLGDARALPLCNVGTLLTHDGKAVELSHCVEE